MKKYKLGIEDMAYSKNGLANFYWPVDRKEILIVRDNLLNELIPRLRHTDPLNQSVSVEGSIRVVFKWFILNTLELYQAIKIITTFKKTGYELDIPKRFQLLTSIYNDKIPVSPFLKLWAGPGRKVNALTGLKRLIRSYQINGYKSGLQNAYFGGCDIVAIERNELLARQARSIRDCVGYTFPEDWFGEIELSYNKFIANVFAYLPNENIDRINELAGVISTIFVEQEVAFNDTAKEYVCTWIKQANYFVVHHISNLLNMNKRIPTILWTGTSGGNIWTRLLCHAVQVNGGNVVGHDHGNGDAHYEQLPKHFVEFDDCDLFITYNKTSQMVIKREMREEYLLGASFPEIQSTKMSVNKNAKNTVIKEVKQIKRKPRIMYVATAFHGYEGRLRTLLLDPVYFDWQIRLLSNLQEWGYSAIYKPHPHGKSKAPVDFAEQFGHVTSLKPFEEVMQQADLFIIDFIASTTVADMFLSGKPVVFIDFRSPHIYPEAYNLLKESCYIFDGYIDSNNRVQVDFERMQKVIKDALNMNTKDPVKFSKKYFENVHTIFN